MFPEFREVRNGQPRAQCTPLVLLEAPGCEVERVHGAPAAAGGMLAAERVLVQGDFRRCAVVAECLLSSRRMGLTQASETLVGTVMTQGGHL